LKKRFLSFYSLIAFSSLSGTDLVVDDAKYFKYLVPSSNVELIYSKDNLEFAKHAVGVEETIYKEYKTFFDWKLDERLYVGLASSKNQIANAFTTQFPYSKQINFMGGTPLIDEFSAISWLDTLLYHETAHTYQMNIKQSRVSQFLHKYFKNGIVFVPYPVILPNLMENSFLVEGNAVLNESWHKNGGRLYNGFYKAQTIIQAHAGRLKPNLLYNKNINFPYGDIPYIQGGFYQLYLAKNYSLKRVNSYFKNRSKYFYWPFLVNKPMKDTIGKSFQESVKDFEQLYKKLYKSGFRIATGMPIITSKFFEPLNADKDSIYFLANPTGVEKRVVVVLNKKDKSITTMKKSLRSGKLFKLDGKFYSVASAYTDIGEVTQALFDENSIAKPSTKSKVVQGVLKDNRLVYFDVKKSFINPQLYVGNKFYDSVNSSVFVDSKDNIYYFKQNGKRRTLFKNKKPIYSYNGYYGIVCDVDLAGNIYFIANSKLGSTLYVFKDSQVYRVSNADNIRDAKLLNDKEVLISAIDADNYYYVINKLIYKKEKPYDTKLFFEDKDYYKNQYIKTDTKITKHKEYNALLDMHYSGVDIDYITLSDVSTSFAINFEDPLGYNKLSTFFTKDEVSTLTGITYENTEHRLSYNATFYAQIDNNLETGRDLTLSVGLEYPLYKKGYKRLSSSFNYFQDYETNSREPVSISLNASEGNVYGLSMYYNYLNSLELYGVKERDDLMAGFEYSFWHDIVSEFYISFNSKYSVSNADKISKSRGVKITDVENENDPATIEMPSTTRSLYAKKVFYADVALYKVLNFSKYFFKFPFSLQREALYLKHRYYNLESFSSNSYDVNEITFGSKFDIVVGNIIELPISFEYIHNDATFLSDSDKVRLVLSTSF